MKNWQKIIIIIIVVAAAASCIYGYFAFNDKNASCDDFNITMPQDYSVLSTTDHAISIEDNHYTDSIFKIQKLYDKNVSYIKNGTVGEFTNDTTLLSSDTINMTDDNFTNFTVQKTFQASSDEYKLYAEFEKNDTKYSITRTYDTEKAFNDSADKDLGKLIEIADSLTKN